MLSPASFDDHDGLRGAEQLDRPTSLQHPLHQKRRSVPNRAVLLTTCPARVTIVAEKQHQPPRALAQALGVTQSRVMLLSRDCLNKNRDC